MSNATTMLRLWSAPKGGSGPKIRHQTNVDKAIYERYKLGLVRIPPETVAEQFSVETQWAGNATPFGVHKPWSGLYEPHHHHKLHALVERCPEARLLCPYAAAAARKEWPNAGQQRRLGDSAGWFVEQFCAESGGGSAEEPADATAAVAENGLTG